MKERTVTVREGEWLGPVDWDYDFESHDWAHRGSFNPEMLPEHVERLRTLAEGLERGEEWQATTYGGWPRCGWGRVLRVGMYDGWPYWRPVPSVLIESVLGAESGSFTSITDIRAPVPTTAREAT